MGNNSVTMPTVPTQQEAVKVNTEKVEQWDKFISHWSRRRCATVLGDLRAKVFENPSAPVYDVQVPDHEGLDMLEKACIAHHLPTGIKVDKQWWDDDDGDRFVPNPYIRFRSY